jgi:hypothetical protein
LEYLKLEWKLKHYTTTIRERENYAGGVAVQPGSIVSFPYEMSAKIVNKFFIKLKLLRRSGVGLT